MKNWTQLLSQNWRMALGSKSFKFQLLFTVCFFIFSSIVSVYFIDKCESRNGVILHDVVLDVLPHRDVSIFIFALTYSVIIVAIVHSSFYPEIFVKGLQMYGLLLLMRALFIALFPLNPPHEMIQMQDKIGEFLLNEKNTPITKDLFFSGHTSTLFLMLFIVQNKKIQRGILIACLIVPLLLLIQHVHYSVDIMAAPFFSYAIFTFVNAVHKQLNSVLSTPAWLRDSNQIG